MAIGNVLEPSHMYDFTAFTGAQTLPNAPIDSPIPCRGVTIHFNNDSICNLWLPLQFKADLGSFTTT